MEGCSFCGGCGPSYAPFWVVLELPHPSKEKTAQKPFVKHIPVCDRCYHGEPYREYKKKAVEQAGRDWETFQSLNGKGGSE